VRPAPRTARNCCLARIVNITASENGPVETPVNALLVKVEEYANRTMINLYLGDEKGWVKIWDLTHIVEAY